MCALSIEKYGNSRLIERLMHTQQCKWNAVEDLADSYVVQK